MTIVVLIWLAVGGCLVDAFRRPAHFWAEADRDRGWWVSMLVVSFRVLPAIFIVPAYLMAVVPMSTSRASLSHSTDPFRKDATPTNRPRHPQPEEPLAVALRSHSCGEPLRPGARFCPGCGRPI